MSNNGYMLASFLNSNSYLPGIVGMDQLGHKPGMYTRIPINNYNTLNSWYRVGLVVNKTVPDKHGNIPNTTILTLYRQDILPGRDLYKYKVCDNFAFKDLEIYIPNVTYLKNNDVIPCIIGFENKGPFTVKLDDNFSLSYIRL